MSILTDSTALMQMLLRKQTDLPAPVLQRFEGRMWDATGARLLGVELSDRLADRHRLFHRLRLYERARVEA